MAQVIRQSGFILCMLTLLLGCGTGTETGNPGGTPSNQPGGEDSGGAPINEPFGDGDGVAADCPFSTVTTAETALDELLQRLCLRIFICRGIPTLDCLNALNGTDGDQILDEFGILPEGLFTVDHINSGLEQGIISTDDVAFGTCKMDIDNVNCSLVSTITADDFSTTGDFIPVSCNTVFDVPTGAVDTCTP